MPKMNDSSKAADRGIGQRALGGAAFLGLSQIVKLVLTILSAIVIARILSPDDYGVVAMVTPVIAFITMFQDFGLSAAAVQRRSITQEQASALFWVNVYASISVAALLIVLSPVVGAFYGDVRATYVTIASSLAVVITGFGLQQSAHLNRNLRFSAISFAEISSALIAFISSAISALLIRSYWALVIGTVAGAATQLTILWLKTDWRPYLDGSVKAARELLGFGSRVTTTNVLNYFVRNADNIMIAKFAGASQLGLYDRSYKLMMLPIQNLNGPLARLLLPNLSSLRDNPALFRKSYKFAICLLMLITVPGVMTAAVFSDRLMPLLLGARWAATAPIFFWLGLTGIIQPVANMTGVLFMSTDRTKMMVRWGLFSAIVTIAGFVAGLQWGPEGIAASLFITMALRLPLLFWLSSKDTPVLQRDLYLAQFLPLTGALIGVGLATTWATYLESGPFFCLTIPVVYLCSLLGMLAVPSGRSVMAQAGSMLRTMVVRFTKRRGRRGEAS